MASTPDGALVESARAGDQRAFGRLFDEWFDRVHDVSWRIVRDDGIAAEIAQDVFLTAWTKLATLEDVDAFGGWVLRISRNASLNRLARERRSVTTDDDTMTAVLDASAPDEDPLARLDQAGRIALVWDAAAALGERDASVLDLHLRHGLGPAELATELGTNPNNAHQILFTLRKRLGNAVRALVLWRAGRPTCDDLRRTLAAAGLTSFGAPMVKVIDRHVDACPTCSTDRTERLDPAALFAAAPVVAAGLLVRSNAAAALSQAGVPMAGSAAAAGAGATGGAPMASTAAASGGADGGAEGAGPSPDPGRGGSGSGDGPTAGPGAEGPAGDDRSPASRLARRRMLMAAAVVVAVAIGVAVFVVAGSGDDEPGLVVAGPTSEPAGSDSSEAPGGPAGDPRQGSTTTSVDAVAGPTGTGPLDPPVGPNTGAAPPSDPDPGQPTSTAPTGAVSPPSTGPAAPPASSASPPEATGDTTTTTSAPPATTTTAPTRTPPVIDRFEVNPSRTRCRGGYRWGVVWATTGAESVTVGRHGATPSVQPVDGKATLCAPAGATFEIRATGPGGTASRTVVGVGPAGATTTSPSIVTPRSGMASTD